jgi:transposase
LNLATDAALQKRVEHLIVHEGRSTREVTRIIGCHRKTVARIMSALNITAGARNNAARDALILQRHRQGAAISAISRETGVSRPAVRRVIDAGAGDSARRGFPKSLAEQCALAHAALQAAYPGERYRDVPDDREVERWSPPRAAIDNGPAVPRHYEPWKPARPPIVPPFNEAEKTEDEEIAAEIVALHENDELSARQIAYLIGEAESRVRRVLKRHQQLAA